MAGRGPRLSHPARVDFTRAYDPSRQNFPDMINDPAYQEFKHLRDEAVATPVLQPTTPAT